MKTKINFKIVKFAVVILFVIASAPGVLAQFAPADTIIQTTAIEERKGSLSTYTVQGPPTDQYTWEVVGGTITSPASGVTGAGTALSPYVVPYTVGQTEITVQWPVDDSTITSSSGRVSVQRKVESVSGNAKCPSMIQVVDVTLWSNPTITIQDADYEICSGDATNDSVHVAFTGAPDFDFRYTITDTEGNVSAEQTIAGTATGTAIIPIDGNLVNSSSTDDQTYTVTITGMNDAFASPGGDGTIIDGTFTITVHPTVETGDITSNNGLTR